MNNVNIKSTFFRADQMLRAAQRELLKSNDDTVPFMICSNARKSIANHLHAYLYDKGLEIPSSATLVELVNHCRKINPKFENIDIDTFFCGSESHDKNFCTDIKKVEACVEVAANVRDLIRDDNWPLSKSVK